MKVCHRIYTDKCHHIYIWIRLNHLVRFSFYSKQIANVQWLYIILRRPNAKPGPPNGICRHVATTTHAIFVTTVCKSWYSAEYYAKYTSSTHFTTAFSTSKHGTTLSRFIYIIIIIIFAAAAAAYCYGGQSASSVSPTINILLGLYWCIKKKLTKYIIE